MIAASVVTMNSIDIAIAVISNIVQHQNHDVCDWLLTIILKNLNHFFHGHLVLLST